MTEDGMPARSAGAGDRITFFAATLVLRAVSVGFEIGVRGRRELAAMAAGFAFFQAANMSVHATLHQHRLPAPPLSPHFGLSYLCSVVPMAYKGHESMFQHEELVCSSWIGAYSALCFSCGHVAYGQLDMLRYQLCSGWIPGILLHQLIVLICFTLALYRNVTINYLILTLLCETTYENLRQVLGLTSMIKDA